MKKEVTKRPYFLLAEPEALDDDLLNGLLGLAVENPYKPLRGVHRPRHPLKPRDAIDYLYPPNYVICKDFKRVERRSKTIRASSKLERLVTLALQRGGSQTEDLGAAGFRRISMRDARTKIEDLLRAPDDAPDSPVLVPAAGPSDGGQQSSNTASEPETTGGNSQKATAESPAQTGTVLSNLFKSLGFGGGPAPTPTPTPTPNPEFEEASRKAAQLATRLKYRKEVLSLLQQQEDGKLAIVTGFITCSDLTKNLEKLKHVTAKTEAGTGPAELGSYVDVQLGAEYSRTHDVGTQGAYEGEYLIACSYIPLYLTSKPKARKVPFLPLKVVSANAKDEPDFLVGPEEIWRVGDEEIEGNMAATLGAHDNNQVLLDDDDEVEGCEDEAAFSLLYREEDPGDDDLSDAYEDESEDDDDNAGAFNKEEGH